eukprot:GFUD01037953.1.p1 GENE.GFUD01037953.1~~GFUD01037953.1.p1  ORF type:complete len:647 (+),score=163.85 GFUD01037953.1:84-2024(+)
MLDPMLSAAETVKTTFQHTFKTGNIIWDTIINSIIIMFVGYATTWIGYVIRSVSLERIKGTLLFCLGFRKQSISITGMITRTGDKHWPTFSQRFKAVLYKIKKLELAESKINGLKEIKIDNETDFFVNQTLYFQFAPHVYGSIWQYETQKSGQTGSAYTEELFMIEVYSWKKGLQELKDILETWENEYKQSFLKQTIKLTGKIVNDKYGDGIQNFEFSDRFFAVLHKIGTVDHGDTAPDLVELHIKEPGRPNPFASASNPETPMHKRKEVSRLVPKQFKFDDNVSGEVDWFEDKENKSTVVYTISIHTNALSYSQLSTMVSTWEKEYEDYKYSQNGLHFYSYNPVPESDGDDYNEFPFQSSKTFDNLFFSEKEKIVSRVKFFSENETWYAERGVPYTLGFLFHGLPGTGKTSSIKAIANMTQRHIVSVPLKNVKNIEDLYKVFYGSTINKKSIPINKRIFVLEDIDAASLEDTVKRRDEDQNKLEGDQDTDSDADTDKDEETGKAATIKKLKKELREKEKLDEKKLTLADLLEVFDGVMEMKGRIMVITTNHPEKLDRALIRPGRVDINMKFGYCQPDDILDIFRNFYGEQSIPAEFDRYLLPGNCWTAAEAIQVFLNNMDNPARGLEMICEASSIDQEKITLFQG